MPELITWMDCLFGRGGFLFHDGRHVALPLRITRP